MNTNERIAKVLGWTKGGDGLWMPPPPHDKWNAPVPDYYHDEAANSRLLDSMLTVELVRVAGILETNDTGWRCDPYGYGELKHSVVHSDRKTAVLLAFCKFHGIEVGS